MQARCKVSVCAAMLSAGLIAGLSDSALAQSGQGNAAPHDAVTAPSTDKPIAAVPAQLDPDAQRVLAMLAGSFAAPAKGEQPALMLNSAPVSIAGLPGAVYFEIARADAPADPFRAGIFWVYRRRADLHLRTFDLVGAGGLKDALVGTYLAPDTFPAIDLAGIQPNVDIALTEAAGVFSGATACPMPTMRDGAVDMTSAVKIGATSVSFADKGFNESGSQVWGSTDSEGIVFTRAAKPAATITRSPEALIVMTLVEPKAGEPKLVEGGEIVVQYTGWLTNGTRFDTSRQPGREPFKIRIPGGVIKGWNEGLKNMAKGERRRLIIPPALAYGDRGAGRGLIPPNATLVFDIECLFVDNSNPTPTPPPPPPPPAAAPGAAPAAPAGQPAGQPGGQPSNQIGSPAKNSAPEKPR